MEKIDILVKYLQDLEQDPSFQPWDDNAHAVKNLVSVFGCDEELAAEAVQKANVFSKE